MIKDLNELSKIDYEPIETKMSKGNLDIKFLIEVVGIVLFFLDELRRAIEGKKLRWYSLGVISRIIKAVLKMVRSLRGL